jgi:exo-beta-1,3-glucanase (GH17 family)
MKRLAFLLIGFVVVAELAVLAWGWPNRLKEAGADVSGQIASMSFAPFRDGQSPLTQKFPSREQIDEDLARLKGVTRGVRTYTSREGMEAVPPLAEKYGIKVIQSAWITSDATEKGARTNDAEIDSLIQLAKEYPDTVERVIVGNEVLLRRDLTSDKLIAYIRKVKAEVKQPVSYADVWAFWLKYPEVAKEVDFITIHILPYWEDEPVGVDDVGPHFEKIHKLMSEAFPGKPILIGEAGWPTQGRQRGPADPGNVNAAKHLRTLVQTSIKNGFDYNLVEAFDQQWKYELEGTVGAKWGFIDGARELKYPLIGKVSEDAGWMWKAAASILLALLMLLPFKNDLMTGRLRLALGTVAFAQLLAGLFVRFATVSYGAAFTFWTSVSPLIVGAALLVLCLASLRQTAAWSAGRLEAPPLWLRRLLAIFVVYALVMAVALAHDGRYRDIPLPLFSILAAVSLGMALIARLAGAECLNACAGLSAFSGIRGNRCLAWLLPLASLDSLLGEGLALIGEDFVKMHPTLNEQVPLILAGTISNCQINLLAVLLLLLSIPYVSAWSKARRGED